MEELRDSKGNLVARRQEFGMQDELRNDRGDLVGRFDRNTNTTRDANGNLIGRGDHLAHLLK